MQVRHSACLDLHLADVSVLCQHCSTRVPPCLLGCQQPHLGPLRPPTSLSCPTCTTCTPSCAGLVARYRQDMGDVAVLTPYKAQLAQLRRTFQQVWAAHARRQAQWQEGPAGPPH